MSDIKYYETASGGRTWRANDADPPEGATEISKTTYDNMGSSGGGTSSQVSGGTSSQVSGPTIPAKPEEGMVLQYTGTGNKVRWYNPDTKGYTQWYSTSTGSPTDRPSGSIALVTESYKRDTDTQKPMPTRELSRVADEPQYQEGTKYIIGYDNEGNPLTASYGFSKKYAEQVIPLIEKAEAKRESREREMRSTKVVPYDSDMFEGRRLTTEEEVKRETSDKFIDKVRNVVGYIPAGLKRAVTETREEPSAVLREFPQAVGGAIKLTGTKSAELLGIKLYESPDFGLRVTSIKEAEKRGYTSVEENLAKDYKKLSPLSKVVSAATGVGTFMIGTRPFMGLKPVTEAGTRSYVFKDKKTVLAESRIKDIREPTFFFKRKPISTIGLGKKINDRFKGMYRTFFPDAKSTKVSYIGRFNVKPELSAIERTARGTKVIRGAGEGTIRPLLRVTSRSYSYTDDILQLKFDLKFPTQVKDISNIYHAKYFQFTGKELGSGKTTLTQGRIFRTPTAGEYAGIRHYFSKGLDDIFDIPIKISKAEPSVPSNLITGAGTVTKTRTATQTIKPLTTTAEATVSEASLEALGKQATSITLGEQAISAGIGTTLVSSGKSTFTTALPKLKPLSGTDVFSDQEVKVGTKVKQLMVIKSKSKQKGKQRTGVNTDVKITPREKIGIGISPAVSITPKQAQKQLPRTIPRTLSKTKLVPKQAVPEPPAPLVPMIPTFPVFFVPPLPRGSRKRQKRDDDLYTGYKKFNIPAILIGTERKVKGKKVSLKMPKMTFPDIKI